MYCNETHQPQEDEEDGSSHTYCTYTRRSRSDGGKLKRRETEREKELNKHISVNAL
jgi:hypothetical protein